MLGYLSITRHVKRESASFSPVGQGRAESREIAKLIWRTTNDAQGEIARVIALPDSAPPRDLDR
jgi:hypothetical protein